jgi:hypothetical protein
MRCIFCLEERPGSLEHVIPAAIGGTLTTDRVCVACNSSLGHRVDAALCDNFVLWRRRAKFGLAGNSGKVPQLYEPLLGVGKLVDYPGQIHATYNEETGKLDVRMIPYISDVPSPEGTITRQIILDERDIGQLPKIIQRERKRRGLPPFSDEELAKHLEGITLTPAVIENPTVNKKLSLDFAYVRHAMIKIAYELAFLWLGEAYLDDPLSVKIRTAICSLDPQSTDSLPAYVKKVEDNELFKFWKPNDALHLAYAFVVNRSIVICLRLFDAFDAAVTVSHNPEWYLSGTDAHEKLRFLAIDAVGGRMQNTSFLEEQRRIAAAIIAANRENAPAGMISTD